MPGHDGTTLRFRCGCGAKISAPASAAGRRARCPNCSAVIVLRADAAVAPRPTKIAPAPGERIKFSCACQARLAVPADRAGK